MKVGEVWATLTPAELHERANFCRDRLADPESERVFRMRAMIAAITGDPARRLYAEQCQHEWALLIDGPGAEALYGCVWCAMCWNLLDGPLP